MAAPIRFLSGRQQQQKIGIEGSTEDKKGIRGSWSHWYWHNFL